MKLISDDVSTDLSARRTGMSFQRTRLSADRTLMSVIRTSLSLISFGFTIHQVAERLRQGGVLPSDVSERTFGAALIVIGIVMLIMGIIYHIRFMLGLRHERMQMTEAGEIHGESKFPPSMTLITAVLLLIVGVVAIVSIAT